MSELHDMMERSMLESLMPYILYGSDSTKERISTYEREVNSSYERFFCKLEAMFPTADRHNDEFYGTVLDFAVMHDEIFLEIGLLAGFNICKDLSEGYNALKTPEFQTMILEWLNFRRGQGNKDIRSRNE